MKRLTRKQIEELSAKISKQYAIQPPIDHEMLENLVKKMGGELCEDSLDSDIDGQIEKKDNSFKITINKSKHDNQHRKNFTIAHEIGHLFLHMHYLEKNEWDSIKNYVDSVKHRFGYSEEEYEANHFAASLLMPKDKYENFIKQEAKNNKNRIEIQRISNHFNVSREAAITRGKWLGIFSWDI